MNKLLALVLIGSLLCLTPAAARAQVTTADLVGTDP